MLSDQGQDVDDLNRALVGLATGLPMMVYLAILHAEIDFYRRYCERSDYCLDSPFSEYLNARSEYIERLGGFRDSYLHPGKAGIDAEVDFLGQDNSYNLAPELQHCLNTYLVGLKERLRNESEAILDCLPEEQRLFCLYYFTELNAARMAKFEDSQGIQQLTVQVKDVLKSRKALPQEVRGWVPSPRQLKAARVLARCMNEVRPATAERQIEHLEPLQTPVDISLLSAMLEMGPNGIHGDNTRFVRPFVENGQTLFRMMMTAAILDNEATTIFGKHAIAEQRKIHEDEQGEAFVDRLLGSLRSSGVRRIIDCASLYRVVYALVYEPLRLYRDASANDDSMRIMPLDGFGTSARLKSLADHRNSVFHVQKPHKAPQDVDLMTTDRELLEVAPDLFVALFAFLGRTTDSSQVKIGHSNMAETGDVRQ
ncbi:MAG: hypothetical protein F4047_17880 [Caldilineaceae bacterium SB0670_bin_27]|nr:hypothetical protein [Caldilineaceae bacterium SB0670_bin_27]